jgi:hypothetical protein
MVNPHTDSELNTVKDRVNFCIARVGSAYRWAKTAGVSAKAIDGLKNGSDLRCQTLHALATAANVPAGWLMFGEGLSGGTASPIVVSPEEFVAVSLLPIRVDEPARKTPCSILHKSDLGGLIQSRVSSQSLVIVPIADSSLAPRFHKGDWALIDRSASSPPTDGEFCVELNGRRVIRDVVFRSNTVVLGVPGFGQIPAETASYSPEQFREKVRMVGRVLVAFKPSSSLVGLEKL